MEKRDQGHLIDAISYIPNTKDIKSLIYIVRGRQVMIDSDLAMLYQVETKVFNQAVRRNIERFPENFRFQLTKEEYDTLRSLKSLAMIPISISTSGEIVCRKRLFGVAFNTSSERIPMGINSVSSCHFEIIVLQA